jgi:hypothetical protein
MDKCVGERDALVAGVESPALGALEAKKRPLRWNLTGPNIRGNLSSDEGGRRPSRSNPNLPIPVTREWPLYGLGEAKGTCGLSLLEEPILPCSTQAKGQRSSHHHLLSPPSPLSWTRFSLPSR